MGKFISLNNLSEFLTKCKTLFYTKPTGGVPKTDLATSVQSSLDLADSAVQAEPVGGEAVQLTHNSQQVYPVTDVSLITGLEERSGMRVIPYTTLPTASAETAGFIYMDESTKDLYITKATSGSYSWVSAGNLSNINLDNYALKSEVSQLGQQINGEEINYEYGTTLAELAHIYQGYQLKVSAAGTALSAVPRANNTNARNARVPVGGASSVTFFQYASSSGYGSFFVDADDKVISGYSKPSGVDNPITLQVPENAAYLIYSYLINLGESTYCLVTYLPNKVITEQITDGAITTEKIANNAITVEKIASGAINDAISGVPEIYRSYNLLNQAQSTHGYIDKRNGKLITLSSGNIYASDYIPVSQNGLIAYPATGYGSYGGSAVYDAEKTFIRATNTPGSYTYQEGDAYVRFTYNVTNGYQCVLECFPDGTYPNITGVFQPEYREQVITPFDGDQIYAKENVPSLIPAYSMSGQEGASFAVDIYSSGTPLRLEEFPRYIKGRANVSVRCKFTVFSPIYVGAGFGLSNGLAVYVTETAIQLRRFTGTDYNTTLLQSIDHGQTMTAFADVEVEFGFYTATARLVTATGSFLAEFNDMSNPEHYGQPFFYAPSGDFTNVSIRTYLKDFRRNVWVIGDSYTSMYQERWTYQLIENMRIDTFLLDGLAGGTSEDMFPELKRMLALGTPKFLVWCLGMNDIVWQWMQYAKEVEMVCRERGITLIYQTIPLPTSNYADKQRINEYIKASGYRCIDSCDAVVADETTREWYDGMLDDGVHPTALGAKALAGQLLADFPEIMQFNP